MPRKEMNPEYQMVRRENQSDEEYVHEHFWDKMKRNASRIPFLLDAIAMYYCAIDPKTPKWAKIVAFSGLAYFILPIDIPDFLVFDGWTDDAAILAGTLKILSNQVKPEHREKAREWAHIEDDPIEVGGNI